MPWMSWMPTSSDILKEGLGCKKNDQGGNKMFQHRLCIFSNVSVVLSSSQKMPANQGNIPEGLTAPITVVWELQFRRVVFWWYLYHLIHLKLKTHNFLNEDEIHHDSQGGVSG